MTRVLSLVAAIALVVAPTMPVLAADLAHAIRTGASINDGQVQPAGASCGCSAEASCGAEGGGKCCVNPCDCCRAKMKVGKRATCVLDPDCYTCCPETKKEKVENYCFNVCAEPVCVPAFRWPWECCCTPKCGKVRAVNVLEKETYECDACVTEWKVKRKSCCRCGNGAGCGCEGGGCAATEQGSAVQTASAETPAKPRRAKPEPVGVLAKLGDWLSK